MVMPSSSFITSIDIVNLAHSLKDICEIDCKTPDCMNTTLKALLQYNLIQLNLLFSEQLCRNRQSCTEQRCDTEQRCSEQNQSGRHDTKNPDRETRNSKEEQLRNPGQLRSPGRIFGPGVLLGPGRVFESDTHPEAASDKKEFPGE